MRLGTGMLQRISTELNEVVMKLKICKINVICFSNVKSIGQGNETISNYCYSVVIISKIYTIISKKLFRHVIDIQNIKKRILNVFLKYFCKRKRNPIDSDLNI